MPTPIISGAIKVTAFGHLFGQECDNVWGVLAAGTPTASDLETICGIFQVAYVDLLAPLSAALTVESFTARYMGDALGPEFTLVNTPAQEGGVGIDSEPGNVALCVSLRSPFSGRRFRGRKFFSAIPTTSVSSNQIDAAVCDAIVAAINDVLMANLEANGTPLAVISLAGLAVTALSTALCTDRFVDSQRRRLTGRGR